MAKLIELDEKKRKQLLVKKLKPGQMYRFSNLVKSEILVDGEDEPRRIILTFDKGVFVRFYKEKNCLVFNGEPLVDIGGLGVVTFFVPLDLQMKMTLVKTISKNK